MDDKNFLNFSHGTTLQNFCKDMLSKEGFAYKEGLRWILNEKEKMKMYQPLYWSVTISMHCYYRYLEKIENALCGENKIVELEKILVEITEHTKKKINALFLAQELACWPSLESVFEAAQKNDDYEVSLVYTPFSHVNYTEQVDYYDDYRKLGLPIQRHNEYDLVGQSPDVVFMIKPYSNIPEAYRTNCLEQVISRIIYIPYGMEITVDLIKFGFQFYTHYKAWRHCAYGEIVKRYGRQYGYRNGENIAVWGHPKADHYWNLEEKKEQIPEEWKTKIRGRKVILWTPHHLIDLADKSGTGTWLIWGKHILKHAMQNTDICFIIRPHPLLFGALVHSGTMTEHEVKELQQKIFMSENIIWDTEAMYHSAFNVADAIITDGTTFSVEFLYTKRPILLTPRNMEGFYLYHEMLDSYYIVNKENDISDFISMIRNNEDPLKEKRYALYEKTFFIPEDCTVGENIIREVKKDLIKECTNVENIMSKEQKRAIEAKADDEKMEKFPLFSILVLCYKNQNLLWGMLDSIFRQDYPKIQLIVSDDGSDDFDVELVRKYIEMNKRSNIVDVLVRKNESNMRTVKHIHHALSYVKGEYLVFTAADDRFVGTDTISTYVEQFLQNPNKIWLVAKCNMTSPDYQQVKYVTPTDIDEPFFKREDPNILFSRWSRRGMAIPCCMAFKMTALKVVGGIDLDYQFLEDWPMVLKLLRLGNMPIFLDKVAALHSMGGITNSNDRYGKEIRKLFYDDKYKIFRKEVEPYLSLLTPEDKKAYKQYMKEIMERHYFFFIDWPDTSFIQKLKLFIKKPIRIWWIFEREFMRVENKIPKKKCLIGSQILLLFSMIFLGASEYQPLFLMYEMMGWIDFAIALLLFMVALGTYPLKHLFTKKAQLRKMLTN